MKIGLKNDTNEWQDEDFWIVKSKNIQFKRNPLLDLQFKELEIVGSFIANVSAHEKYPECLAPLGFPEFSDDFVIFKNCKRGKDLYNKWLIDRNITCLCARENLMPAIYPPALFYFHTPQDEKPPIRWGK